MVVGSVVDTPVVDTLVDVVFVIVSVLIGFTVDVVCSVVCIERKFNALRVDVLKEALSAVVRISVVLSVLTVGGLVGCWVVTVLVDGVTLAV